MERNNGRLRLDGHKLKQLRNDIMLSQSLLVERCNELGGVISLSTLKRAESGKKVYYRTAREIALALQTDVSELTLNKIKVDLLEYSAPKNFDESLMKSDYLESLLKSIQSMGFGHVLYIRGMKGAGKTHFIKNFQKLTQSEGFQDLYLKLGVSFTRASFFKELLFRLVKTVFKPGAHTNEINNIFTGLEDINYVREDYLYEILEIPREKINNNICFDLRIIISLLSKVDRPLNLIIEDIHLAAPCIIDFLRDLTAKINGIHAILVLSSLRDKDPLKGIPSFFTKAFTTLDIPALSHEKSMQILGEHPHIKQDDMACLIRLANGNPFFLNQLAENYPGSITLIPDKLIQLVHEKIKDVSNDELLFLKIAASLSGKFSPSLITTILKSTPLCLKNLTEKYILSQLNDGYCEFYEEVYRKGIYQITSVRERCKIHYKLAQFYYNIDKSKYLRHIELAKEHSSVGFLGEDAYLNEFCESVLPELETALSICRPQDKFSLIYLKASVLKLIGQPKESIQFFEEAFTLAQDHSQKLKVSLELDDVKTTDFSFDKLRTINKKKV